MAGPGRRLLVVGDVLTDVVAVLDRPLRADTDTPGRVRTQGGGSAANTAHWLAAVGAPVTFVGRVGDDDLGRAACRQLADAGVDLEVTPDPELPTGTCVVLVAPDGGRTMVPDPGANLGLRRAHVRDGLLRAGDHLHLSGYTLLREPTRDTALSLLADARAHAMTTSLDAASAGPIVDVGADRVRTWLSGLDVLLANADEAGVLAGTAAPDPASALAQDLGATVVVKRGSDGVQAATPAGVRVDRPAVATTVVDTTGAGDSFAAGLLARLVRLDPGRAADPDALGDALAGGLALAARAVARVGARP